MSEQPTSEERAVLAVLGELEEAPAPAVSPAPPPAAPALPAGGPAADAQEGETLRRLYLEVVGLMAFAEPPAAPRPAAKRRLMAAVAPAPAPADPARSPVSLDVARVHAARRAGPARWPLALAAALVLVLLGTSAWLYHGLTERQGQIARLAAERDTALRHAGEIAAQLGELHNQVGSLRANVAMVTSPAVEVCNLRAVATSGSGGAVSGAPDAGPEEARGMLFVAADHQHWYMSLHGLRPPGNGMIYQLWFVADQGMVSGGTFAANLGAPAELSSERMPAGTRGVRITLERSPGAPAPSGPDVLRNVDALHGI